MNTTTGYRPPTSALRSWRPLGAEIACTAQLLYMYDLLLLDLGEGDQVTPDDMAAFEARVANTGPVERDLVGMDLDGGLARVLFEEGFELRHVTADDLHLLATDPAYHRQVLLDEGLETPEYLDQMLPTWTPIVQRRVGAHLALYEQYRHQVEVIREPSTWPAVQQLLADGFHVEVATVNDDGTTRACLIVAETAPGRHLVFEPIAAGVMEINAAAVTIGENLAQGIHAWRRP